MWPTVWTQKPANIWAEIRETAIKYDKASAER